MLGQSKLEAKSTNPMKDFEVIAPPDDTVSALKFSPAALSQNYLIAGSWDSSVRCWEVDQTGKTLPKAIKTMDGCPVLDACWSDDGTKVFIATKNKVKLWDLISNQTMQVAAHQAPVKTCHWIKGSNYACLMTGSWDKTLKFWDTRSAIPMLSFNLPERCYCTDVDYPMAVVGTAGKSVIVYSLENTPTEFRRQEGLLKYQHRSIAIFRDKKQVPTGYAVGSIEGRVVLKYLNPARDRVTFKCHRSPIAAASQDIYAINDMAFHPIHGTLVTVGSDGTFCFWDIDGCKRLKISEQMDQAITKCSLNANGQIFAYALGYDWSKGYEYFNSIKKPQIFLRRCYEELNPRNA
uniref:mRNA export factor n=1 Tax=Glossina pallidipes TaxID=7398 RepID=A0A1B0ACE9_GLOPL